MGACLAILACASIAGCGAGSAQSGPEPTTPFTDAHAAVFEDGLDMVTDPSVLEGSWLDSWSQDVDARVTMADVVALVTIRTLRTDLDLERTETYRLVAHVDEVYLGEDVGEELVLSVREGEGGFGTVRNNERRILDSQFLVFVKWAREEGRVRARWHLSPAAEPVARYVHRLLYRRRRVRPGNQGRRVIVRRGTD